MPQIIFHVAQQINAHFQTFCTPCQRVAQII